MKYVSFFAIYLMVEINFEDKYLKYVSFVV